MTVVLAAVLLGVFHMDKFITRLEPKKTKELNIIYYEKVPAWKTGCFGGLSILECRGISQTENILKNLKLLGFRLAWLS